MPSPSAFLALPLFNILAFAVLIGLGIANRTRSGFNKRYMTLATASLIPAAVARLPLALIANGGPPVFFGLGDLFILGCAAYDLSLARRIHPATLWSGAIILASQVLTLAVGTTGFWKSFSDWLIS